MACCIHKCVTHKLGYNDEPCKICFTMGDLLIEPTQVTLRSDILNCPLYKVIEPFTRENLMSLNDIDTQEPGDYVRALKRATLKECPFIPIGYESVSERIRTKMERMRGVIPKYKPTTDSENKTQLGAWGRRYRWNSPEPSKN